MQAPFETANLIAVDTERVRGTHTLSLDPWLFDEFRLYSLISYDKLRSCRESHALSSQVIRIMLHSEAYAAWTSSFQTTTEMPTLSFWPSKEELMVLSISLGA